jgi:transcriptional regulator with XRE-family HTH domain
MDDAEQSFGTALRKTRRASGRSQESVAEAMRAVGFPSFSQLHVSRIERARRPLRLDEAFALCGLFDIDFVQVVVSMIAGERGSEMLAIEERVARVHLAKLNQERIRVQQQREDMDRAVERLRADLALAESEWEKARQRLKLLKADARRS